MSGKVEWLLNCKPRPVQEEALRRSFYAPPHPKRGWGHFLEMRLGKTPTALNEFLLLQKYHGVKHLLVVAPNKYKASWEEEAKRLMKDPPPCRVFKSGKESERFIASSADKPAMLFTNYEAVRSHLRLLQIKEFASNAPTLLVLDESAMMKNPAAKVTKAILKHLIPGPKSGNSVKYVRCLSGLPAPYAPYDLWSQLKAMGENTLFGKPSTFWAFKQQFTEFGGWMGKVPVGPKNEKELDKIMTAASFRAKQKDWGITQGVDYEVVNLDMCKEQVKAYKEMTKDFLLLLEGSEPVTVETVLAKHMKLQQISSGFIYGDDSEPIPIVPFRDTPKMKDLIDRLLHYLDTKVLIFAHHRYTIQRLMWSLHHFNPARITGGMSDAQIIHERARFNTDDSCRVLVAQSTSAKYGHTLVGSKAMPCNSICFFENNYNLDTRIQCEARPQGPHRKSPLHVWDYCSSPIERKIVDTLNKRKKVSANVIMKFYKEASSALQ